MGWFDIDSNQHVNNVVYIRWLLEQLPNAVLSGRELVSLDVVYKNESHWRDSIQVAHCLAEPDTYLHRVTDGATGKDVVLAKTGWR